MFGIKERTAENYSWWHLLTVCFCYLSLGVERGYLYIRSNHKNQREPSVLDISQATAQPPARISPAKGRKGFLQYSRVKIQKHEIFPSRIECRWSKFPLLFYFPRFLCFLGSKANLILKLSMNAERTTRLHFLIVHFMPEIKLTQMKGSTN